MLSCTMLECHSATHHHPVLVREVAIWDKKSDFISLKGLFFYKSKWLNTKISNTGVILLIWKNNEHADIENEVKLSGYVSF